jgi:hypothetical protein
MRAELEAAGAVDVLLELLGSRHDTKVQACFCTISVAAPPTDACGASTADEAADESGGAQAAPALLL